MEHRNKRVLKALMRASTAASLTLLASCSGPPDMPVPGIWLEEQTRGPLPAGVEWRSMGPTGLTLTKESEEFRGKLYDDPVGFCTIGYGHLVKKKPCDGTEPKEFIPRISEPDALALLRKDLRLAEYPVLSAVTPDVLAKLTELQFDALCDFTFNVGAGNFRESTLLKAINAEEFHRVPGQLRRWVYASGKKLRGLETRREREIELFMADVRETRGPIPADEDLSPIDLRCEVADVTGSARACATAEGEQL